MTAILGVALPLIVAMAGCGPTAHGAPSSAARGRPPPRPPRRTGWRSSPRACGSDGSLLLDAGTLGADIDSPVFKAAQKPCAQYGSVGGSTS